MISHGLSHLPRNSPILQTWKSAHAFANSDHYHSLAVTREEYNEGGSNACRRKFRNFDWDPIKDKVTQPSRSTRREKLESNALDENGQGEGESDNIESPKAPTRKRQKSSSTKMKREFPRHKWACNNMCWWSVLIYFRCLNDLHWRHRDGRTLDFNTLVSTTRVYWVPSHSMYSLAPPLHIAAKFWVHVRATTAGRSSCLSIPCYRLQLSARFTIGKVAYHRLWYSIILSIASSAYSLWITLPSFNIAIYFGIGMTSHSTSRCMTSFRIFATLV